MNDAARDSKIVQNQADFAHREIVAMMQNISKLFLPGMRLTFIARMPGNENAEVIFTEDTSDGIRGVLNRMELRQPLPREGTDGN